MEGNNAFNEMIKKLCNFRFVNLMIDAGTVINMRVVHSTLSNPYSGMAPLPFRTVQKKGNDWECADYQLEIETAISEIDSYNSMNFDSERIFIVSICHDRLPAQATAVSKVIKMLKEQSDRIPIVDVSCLNHLIHNSFLGAINRCNAFQSLIEDITFIVSIFRKREAVDFVGKKIPNPPQNRWIYLCDVLHFVIYNIEKINQYLIQYWLQTHQPLDDQTPEDFEKQAHDEAPIRKNLIELFYILTPLQKASLCFECEQARLADVFPVLQTLFKSYKLILDNSRIEMESSLEILQELLC